MKSDFYNFVTKALNIIGILQLFAGAIWFGIVITSVDHKDEFAISVGIFTSGLIVSAIGQVMVALSRLVDKINPQTEADII